MAKPLSARMIVQPARSWTSARMRRLSSRAPRSTTKAGVATPSTGMSRIAMSELEDLEGQAAGAELFEEGARVELLHVEDAVALPLAREHHGRAHDGGDAGRVGDRLRADLFPARLMIAHVVDEDLARLAVLRALDEAADAGLARVVLREAR